MIPSHAHTVIIGGGIMGCGLAYHLAHLGWRDVVLLEKAELTSGSTWHAAGQITHSTSSYGLGKCVGYAIQLYAGELEAETGQSVTWHGCGSLRLAYTQDELDWLQQTISVGRGLGFPMEIISPEHIRKLHPFYQLDGVLAALHTPDDGHVDPAGATLALASGARAQGAKIIRRCRAIDIQAEANGGWRVITEQGAIKCEHLVNAGGTYARQIALMSGYDLPATSMTHHYFVTEPIAEFAALDRELPVIRDDRHVSGYVRMEQHAGLIGIYEKANPNHVWEDSCPWESEHELFDPDYDRVMPWLEAAFTRMPVLEQSGIKRVVHGAISHPPDGNPLIGPAPTLSNYWCCCGTQIGIGWGPGLTRELAQWMVTGAAEISMREFDPRRFGRYADQPYQIAKAREDYLLRHEIPFPHFNRLAHRPVRTGPLYSRLCREGAVHEEVAGWERPRWFARDGQECTDLYSFRRTKLHSILEAEIMAVQHAAGIMDLAAFTRVEITGLDATQFCNRLVANRLPNHDGRIVLAHMLNQAGRIELEVTIARLDQDQGWPRFYVVCAAFFEQRLLDHLNHHRCGFDVQIINRSDEWAGFAVNGPKSRALLQQCSKDDLEAFRWMRAKKIAIAGHDLWAFQLSYVGESGWELHGPASAIAAAYDAIRAVGTGQGLSPFGSFAMNSMRLEKAFKGASELTNEVTLFEANMMRFVHLDSNDSIEKGEFIGKQPMLERMAEGPRWLCAYLEVEADGIADGHGGEAVFAGDVPVGTISSIAYGYRCQRLLAFAYLKPDYARPGSQLRVMIMGQLRSALVLDAPAYDPQNRLPKGLSLEA
ncbi:MAG: FAD-dependent oxidoreductase [Pseudomonadota bacterium]